MTKISDIIGYIETIAPRSFQESYDNAGLIVGDKNNTVTGITISLDITEAVIDEAIQNGDNLIISHHPIIFKGLKKLTGSNYVEKSVLKAIKNDIALFSAHTNLDSVIENGVNSLLCEKLELQNCKILNPKQNTLKKLTTTIPSANSEYVIKELHKAGAGNIGNYEGCSFRSLGIGHFTPNDKANPTIGSSNKSETVEETRVEMIFPTHLEYQIISKLKEAHPYEEVAYFIQSLDNVNEEVGSGMVGELSSPIDSLDFLKKLKTKFNLPVIKHTQLINKTIQKVALCGGSGSFLLKNAIAQQADIFITGDFKYHEFFDAEDKIVIADIGHFESEIHTKDLFYDLLFSEFKSIRLNKCKTNTNPVSYLM